MPSVRMGVSVVMQAQSGYHVVVVSGTKAFTWYVVISTCIQHTIYVIFIDSPLIE